MVKHLYSEIHSKHMEIYLSKLYIGMYYEVIDVIKYTQKTSCLFNNSIDSGHITNYVTLIMSHVQTAVCVT